MARSPLLVTAQRWHAASPLLAMARSLRLLAMARSPPPGDGTQPPPLGDGTEPPPLGDGTEPPPPGDGTEPPLLVMARNPHLQVMGNLLFHHSMIGLPVRKPKISMVMATSMKRITRRSYLVLRVVPLVPTVLVVHFLVTVPSFLRLRIGWPVGKLRIYNEDGAVDEADYELLCGPPF